MPRVTSRDNPRLKAVGRLIASSRERRKTGRCVLEGEHLIAVYCARYGAPEALVLCESALERPQVRAILQQIHPRSALVVADERWPDLALPQAVGALAVVMAPKSEFKATGEFCLLLEDVQDPGNVGSILRSAAAAGVTQVFLSPGCAFPWSPRVLRAGQGGHFHLEIFEDVDLPAWARAYRGKVVATATEGRDSLYEADLTGPVAIAI